MLTVYDGNIWCAEPKDTIAAIGRKLKTIFLSEGPAKIAFFRRFILIFAFDGHLDHTNFIEEYSKAYYTMLYLIHLQMITMMLSCWFLTWILGRMNYNQVVSLLGSWSEFHFQILHTAIEDSGSFHGLISLCWGFHFLSDISFHGTIFQMLKHTLS